jgi:hypothetical protein
VLHLHCDLVAILPEPGDVRKRLELLIDATAGEEDSRGLDRRWKVLELVFCILLVAGSREVVRVEREQGAGLVGVINTRNGKSVPALAEVDGEQVLKVAAMPVLAQEAAVVVQQRDLAGVVQMVRAGHGNSAFPFAAHGTRKCDGLKGGANASVPVCTVDCGVNRQRSFPSLV